MGYDLYKSYNNEYIPDKIEYMIPSDRNGKEHAHVHTELRDRQYIDCALDSATLARHTYFVSVHRSNITIARHAQMILELFVPKHSVVVRSVSWHSQRGQLRNIKSIFFQKRRLPLQWRLHCNQWSLACVHSFETRYAFPIVKSMHPCNQMLSRKIAHLLWFMTLNHFFIAVSVSRRLVWQLAIRRLHLMNYWPRQYLHM